MRKQASHLAPAIGWRQAVVAGKRGVDMEAHTNCICQLVEPPLAKDISSVAFLCDMAAATDG